MERGKREGRVIVGRGSTIRLEVPDRPFNSGEIALVPIREVRAFEELTPDELAEISHWLERIESVLHEVYTPHGINLGASNAYGAFEGRFEIRVVPRWGGDMNFLPVIAGIKVLPESIADTVRAYRTALFGTRGGGAGRSR